MKPNTAKASRPAQKGDLKIATPAAGDTGTAPEYEVVDGGIVWIKRDKNDQPHDVPLANFDARIVRAVVHDDGADETRLFDIDVAVGNRTFPVRGLPATEFASLDWVIPMTLGQGRIRPNMTPRARDAIQYLSGEIPEEAHYGHLGWRRVGTEWVYLHAAGAVGEHGGVPGVTVALGEKFARFVLPDPAAATPKDVRTAVTRSLRMLAVGPDRITAPVVCAAWRAPLGPADFSLHVVGPTGVGKSVLASLAQQFWGADLDSLRLPGSWSSTANANEGLRFVAKDALVVIDDLAPGAATARDIDRTFRGQGNASGRDRMNADSSLRRPKFPRGLLLSTGEDSPLIHSAAARVLVVAVPPDAVNWARVTKRQHDAGTGLYALAMAAYVRWLAARYDGFETVRRDRVAELRAELLAQNPAVHKRTPGIIAELTFGMEQFLAFAQEINAIDDARAAELRGTITAGLGEAAAAQSLLHRDADPVTRFRALLTGALAAGRAHVASPTGSMPQDGTAWGWRENEACGQRIGWVKPDGLFLDPEATYVVLAAMARDSGETLLRPTTLWTRLHERGLLVTTDINTARGTFPIRRMLGNARREVLHLDPALVLGEAEAPPDDQAGDDEEE